MSDLEVNGIKLTKMTKEFMDALDSYSDSELLDRIAVKYSYYPEDLSIRKSLLGKYKTPLTAMKAMRSYLMDKWMDIKIMEEELANGIEEVDKLIAKEKNDNRCK